METFTLILVVSGMSGVIASRVTLLLYGLMNKTYRIQTDKAARNLAYIDIYSRQLIMIAVILKLWCT